MVMIMEVMVAEEKGGWGEERPMLSSWGRRTYIEDLLETSKPSMYAHFITVLRKLYPKARS